MHKYTIHEGSPLERLREEMLLLQGSGKISKLLTHSPDLINKIKNVLTVLMMDGVHEASNYPIGRILQDLNEDMLDSDAGEYPYHGGMLVHELEIQVVSI